MKQSKLRRASRYLVIAGILGIAVVGAVALVGMKPPPEKKDTDTLDLLVEVLPLTLTTAHFTVSSQGTVQPRTETVLSAELSGSIVKISEKFVAGGVFSKNEILLTIDPSNYIVAVDQAKALLTQRKIEYDGALRLKEKRYKSDAEVASAAASLASAEAGLKRARRDLQRTEIRLPYNGMVRSKAVDLGQYVGPGTQLGITFATDFAEVRLPITDQDRMFLNLPERRGLAKGETLISPSVVLRATRDGMADSWPAHITRTEGVVDTNTRVTYAIAHVDDPYNFKQKNSDTVPLLMGSFVKAEIDGTTIENVMKVPRDAMRGVNQLLLADEDDRLRLTTVSVLRTDSQFAYLSGGVTAGDRVVLTAIESPINGTKVRVSGETESGNAAEPVNATEGADAVDAAGRKP